MVSVTGLGSGIDIKSIVEATVAAERAPKDAQLARLEKTSTAKFTALGSLKSAMSELQTALKDLAKPELFGKRTATSSNTSVLSATATKTALSGNYSVEVKQLASASKVATAALSSDFKAASGGQLTVKLGVSDQSAVNVEIAENASLIDIRDALNAALTEKGVSANIVNNPATGKSQLVLSAKDTGAGNDIYLEGTDDLAQLNIDPTLEAKPVAGGEPGQTQAGYLEQAKNAVFKIDGLELESATNTVENAIPDVTFTLLAKSEEGKSLTVKVGQDISGVTSNIKKFVDSYNKLMTTASQLTSVTTVEGSEPLVGNLVGDSTVRNVLSGLRAELGNTSASSDSSLRVLMDLGITTQKDGTLGIDDAKLKAALENNFDAVGGFLAGDKGLMNRLSNRVETYVQTGGILDQRMKGQRSVLDSVTAQRAALDLRVSSMQTRLYAQYNAMDSLVGQLTRTSDWMAGALDSLPGVVKKS